MTTTTNEKLRSLFLAALMVFSVFGGTIALSGGVAAANAPGPAGNQAAGSFSGDQTNSVSTLPNSEVLVADLDFSSNSGEVDEVTVTANEGDSANLENGDIISYRVEVSGNSFQVENSTDVSTLDPATISFNGTDADSEQNGTVDRVKVYATVAADAQVDDDEVIDAGIEIFADDGTTFSGTSPYDTRGSQDISTNAGFITGDVQNSQGEPISDRTGIVEIINANNGEVVRQLDTDAQGEFDPNRVNVAPGSYTVVVNIPGFTTFAQTKEVTSGDTVDFPATVEFNLEADNIRVERFDGQSVAGQTTSTLLADGQSDNTAQYAVIIENSSVAEDTSTSINESSFSRDIDLSFSGSGNPVVGDFVDNGEDNPTTTVTTTRRGDIDNDGVTESFQVFEVTADEANESTLGSEPIVTNNIEANAAASSLSNGEASVQYVLEGNDVITGEITTPSGGLENASVWVSYPGQSNQSLAFTQETFVNNGDAFLTDTSVEDGDYTIDGLALPNSGAVTLYVIAEDRRFNRLNRTDEAVGQFVAAEYSLDSSSFTNSGDREQTDQRVTIFQEETDFEYRLNVTADNADGNPVKSADVAQGDSRDVTVTVEQKPLNREGSFVAADSGQEVSLSLTDPGQGELENTTLVTDSNGENSTSFLAGSAASGTTNVTASVQNSTGETFESTDSEQAEINVFGAAAITGDVVNGDSQNLPNATVRLYDAADTNLETPLVTVTAGEFGSYTISEIDGERLQSGDGPSDSGFIVEAEFNNETETRTFTDLTAGTNDGDIAIIGVTPVEADFQVSATSPANANITQGDQINISATITNTGDQTGEQTVEYRVAGTSVTDSQRVELAGGESTTVTFSDVSTSGLASGEYTLTTSTETSSESTNLTVQAPSAVDQFDTNDNGIEPSEAQDAIVSLNNGEISPSEAQQIIVALNS